MPAFRCVFNHPFDEKCDGCLDARDSNQREDIRRLESSLAAKEREEEGGIDFRGTEEKKP